MSRMGCLFACFREKNVRSSSDATAEIGDSVIRRNQLAALILSEENDTDFLRESRHGNTKEFADEDRFSKICEAVLQKDRVGNQKKPEKKEIRKEEEEDDEATNKFVKDVPCDHPAGNKSTPFTPRSDKAFTTCGGDPCSNLTEEMKADSKEEKDLSSKMTQQTFPRSIPGTAEKLDLGLQGSLTFVSADSGFSQADTEEASCAVDPYLTPGGRKKVNTDGNHRDGFEERSFTPKSKNLEVDRPIIGMVAVHWSEEDDKTKVSPKSFDGNGIPNSTNKYKEDQRVSWHATPFEERLEKALSDEKLFPQRKLSAGRPIKFDEEGEERHH